MIAPPKTPSGREGDRDSGGRSPRNCGVLPLNGEQLLCTLAPSAKIIKLQIVGQ